MIRRAWNQLLNQITHVRRIHDNDQPSVVAQRPPIETEVLSINTDYDISIQQKIRKKVVLAFCGVDGSLFDLSHFNDLPLKLMPRVLELIQEHTATRRKEIIRRPGRGFSLEMP